MKLYAIALATCIALNPQTTRPRRRRPQSPSNHKRVVAIGDVHGDLDALRTCLRVAGVVDTSDDWIGAPGTTLVSTGDVLDRGDEDWECLAYLHTLQAAARRKRGDVCLVLGNHEVLNVLGEYPGDPGPPGGDAMQQHMGQPYMMAPGYMPQGYMPHMPPGGMQMGGPGAPPGGGAPRASAGEASQASLEGTPAPRAPLGTISNTAPARRGGASLPASKTGRRGGGGGAEEVLAAAALLASPPLPPPPPRPPR